MSRDRRSAAADAVVDEPLHPVHHRLPYLAPGERAPLRWPGGRKVALWVVPNVEHYEFLPPVRTRDPYPRSPHPDVRRYAYHDYGNRVGFWRLLEVLDRWEVPATVSLNVAVLEHEPEVTEAMLTRGWELMSHGHYNTRYVEGMDEEEERAFLHHVDEVLELRTGRRFRGMLGPYITANPWTPDLMAEHGMDYHADWVHDDRPSPLLTRSDPLVALPYSYELNDAPLLMRSSIEGPEYVRLVLDQLAWLEQEPGEDGRLFCLPLHPFAIGQPHRIRFLDEVLAACRSRDVWIATASEIVDVYRNQALAPELTVIERRGRP